MCLTTRLCYIITTYFQVLPSNYFQVLPSNKVLIFDQLESQDNDIYKRGITIRIEYFDILI
ncbi:hypothetical protein BLOT_002873 [Blomia tropicalis]|nr:hypothetical protein BLOT_002873 [Blomia tropicalis]